jgi:FixJ family two-component response regulator
MSAQRATVFIVDDDADVRQAVARLVSTAFYKVSTFDSAQDFLARHDPETPGCIVLDAAMPGISGLQLQQFLVASGCLRPIVFLTGVGDIPTSVQAMKAGAVDFLTKPVGDDELFSAIERALRVDQAERHSRSRKQIISRRVARLTPRERQVLEHVMSGQLNKQIACDLGTCEKTVKVHRSRVMHKMGARSVAELILLASCVGIVATPPLRPAVRDEAGWMSW